MPNLAVPYDERHDTNRVARRSNVQHTPCPDSLWSSCALLNSLKRLLLNRVPDRYSRRWPRLAVTEPAHLRLAGGTGQPVIVNQLSVGGARIQTSRPLRAGDNVELAFEHRASGNQNLIARIVYSCKENSGHYFACGLCFMGLAPHQAQWIASYIAAEQARRRAER